MPLHIKSFALLLLLLVLLFHSSSGEAQVFEDGTKPMYPFHKVIMRPMKMRKLMMALQSRDSDYCDGGSNPKHDPHGKKGCGD